MDDGLYEFRFAAVSLMRVADNILRGERLFQAATSGIELSPLTVDALNARIDRWEIAKRAWKDACCLDRRLAELLPGGPLGLDDVESEIEDYCVTLETSREHDKVAVECITVFLNRILRFDMPLYWRGLALLRLQEIDAAFRDFHDAHTDATNCLFSDECDCLTTIRGHLWFDDGTRRASFNLSWFCEELAGIVSRTPENLPPDFSSPSANSGSESGRDS